MLDNKDVVLADGAIGSNLIATGLKRGEPPESWNLAEGARISALHQSFIETGSDIILTNSFGASRIALDRYGLAEDTGEINRAAAGLARAAADGAGRPVLVAGSLGPTSFLLKPIGPLTPEEAEEAYAEQAAALADGGADMLWIETMSAIEEMEAAARGAAATGLPFVATMSFDTKGRTMMGTKPQAALEAARAMDPPPAAFGANCGSHPRQLVATIVQLAEAAEAGEIIIAKGNCGVPKLTANGIQYDGTQAVMADYAQLARDAGARIIGGCCGTAAAHLAAIREALDERPAGAMPDAARIAQIFGPEEG